MGYDQIAPVARMLGLGQKFDMPLNTHRYGTVPDSAWKLKKYKTKWTVADGLNASIGQGYVLANPLQLAVMAARIASGRHLQPSLLAHQVHLDSPALPVASEHLAVVRDAMFGVVNQGGTGGAASAARRLIFLLTGGAPCGAPRPHPNPDRLRTDRSISFGPRRHRIASWSPRMTIDLLDAEFHTFDPWPTYAWMREEAPAYLDEENQVWGITRYDDIIAVLREAPIDGLDAAVDAVKLELTTGFYEHAVRRIDACRSAGDEAEADALDELCGRVMMASDRTFGAILPSLGDGSGEEIDGEASEALVTAGDLTPAQQEQLQRRWDGIAARLAAEGEANAIAQVEKNATSRRDSVVAILGRVPMGPKELRSLNMVTAERRIIDVLLTFPRGPERSDALTDALTPPPETETETDDGDEVNDGRGDNLELTDDDMLVGDEEEVFTTPARLLAAVELAIKEANAGGDDVATVEELRSLRAEVAQRCDFLN